MRLLRRLAYALGPLGMLGIVVLLACAGFYWTTLKPAEQRVAAQRVAASNLKSRVPYRPVSVDRRVEDLQRFQSLFPTLDRLPNEVEKLWILASEYKIELQAGEYRMDTGTPGLTRYRITLPVKGSYAQLRLFVDTILKTIPTMSIDSLRFERKKISETQLDAQLALTLYFRPPIATHRP